MTKTKWHFSQKTMTKTKSKFAVKMNTASGHNTFTQFSSESLANFRQACTCDFLSRGTLRELQDFSPLRRSVLPIVFLVTIDGSAVEALVC